MKKTPERKISKIKHIGFEVSPDTWAGRWLVSMQDVPSKEQVFQLFKTLSCEDEIFFWNYYHPNICDPGAYVTAHVKGKEEATYKEGNHGWSSDYKPISTDDLAELVIKNWDKDCDGHFMNAVQIRIGTFKGE